ncbi:ethanolamine ammonia-lyase reactivating factor EutA [Bacillus sp. T3]|uniref:ethanolamine ammonia-lyase reactivating factor EutA n=1 Tax=Bacillus sp. T3 TaxID=467262 RepID=UPI0029812FCF|nr:ethanolamine ammonia-lyase reactivating factor EutA [Bacillus sp. T3]
MEENWISSIGIDIGTSTTKFIVSQLLISEAGNSFSLPSCQIVDRKVIYSSPIYTTPFMNETEIDITKLAQILEKEYKDSQTSIAEVKAGAVIITGETARKENAESILHYLADRAGDFVVATAGADLEGILAGKGSGAALRSKDVEGIVANVDIGGGTANVALFQNGKAVQTMTFHVGGRLIRLTDAGEITYISPHISKWLQANHFSLKIGKNITFSELKDICKTMAEGMFSHLSGKRRYFADLLLLDADPIKIFPIDEIMISGGVGQMLKADRPATIPEVTKHGDVGPLLASTLAEAVPKFPFVFQSAKETTRATVIGAGMQNTEISGATIHVNEARLPMKNVPIEKIPVAEKGTWNQADFRLRLHNLLLQAVQLYDKDLDPPIALALSEIPYCSYAMLQGLAKTIVAEFSFIFPCSNSLVVLCEEDIAKALGQAITRYGKGKLDVMCVDQVDFTYGDYIDLGLPVAGEAISISVKTLAF